MSTTEIAVQERAPIAVGTRGVQLQTLQEMWRFAEVAVRSGLCPKSIATTEAAMMIVQAGLELGIGPWQALQGMQVINGKVGMSGDLALALTRTHAVCEYVLPVEYEGTGDDFKAVVMSKRRDTPKECRTEFSVAAAKRAALWGKAGPWTQYGPNRMLYYRALGFNLRDNFPECLKGIKTTEELLDYPTKNVTPIARPQAAPEPECPHDPAQVTLEVLEELEDDVVAEEMREASDVTSEALLEDGMAELRERLKSLRADLQSLGEKPRSLTRAQVERMSPEELSDEITVVKRALAAIARA